MVFETQRLVLSGPPKAARRSLCFWLVLALVGLLPLVAFQRFSAIHYPVVRQEDLLSHLVPASDDPSLPKTGKASCRLDMDRLRSYEVVLPRQGVDSPQVRGVREGGVWEPAGCQSSYQVAVVVPYRDRAEHLEDFLRIIHPFLQAQLLSYKIIVVEQTTAKPFNRAMLFNVGYLESKAVHGHTSCLIFHDVDLVPLDARNIYACMEDPRHLSSNLDQFRFNLPYVDLFGGAVAVSAEVFEEANGFSNRFFGWGGEDDDFRQNRLRHRALARLEPSVARYTSLRHRKAEANPNRFGELVKGEAAPDETFARDGLRDIHYKLVASIKKPLYTHVVVDL